ncbi:MAG: FliM/FliN family flagellar motor switch protein [Tatlockia sp.]|nr:FliM/FliN family flagellar motor switch protein [Tatlockia sp.]
MKSQFKPFRLINRNELNFLQKKFLRILTNWNQIYARNPLKMELSLIQKENYKAIKIAKSNDNLLLISDKKPVALLDKSFLSLVKECLFGNQSPCFEPVCEEIIIYLFKELLVLETLQLVNDFTSSSDWFYQGSPCIKGLFQIENQAFNLYLHPDWVISQLPKPDVSTKALTKLDEALVSNELELSIEFQPQCLSLDKLVNLQVGDLIKTSHLMSNPLIIRHQKQAIFEVEAGQIQEFKSVQIKRSL